MSVKVQGRPLSHPQWWFDEVVHPNFIEAKSDWSCLRKRVNAIATTYHFAERIFCYCKEQRDDWLDGAKSPEHLGRCLVSNHTTWNTLNEAVNAVKHQKRKHPPYRTASEVMEESCLPLDSLETVIDAWQDWLRKHPKT